MINSSYFENFVEGGRERFPAYVEHKRQNAVWGDDLEIQAMGEMYGRPVHVYQYHPQHGARMLRRVQTTQHAGIEPMRLSFSEVATTTPSSAMITARGCSVRSQVSSKSGRSRRLGVSTQSQGGRP